MSYLLPKPHLQTGDIITQGGRMVVTIKGWLLVEVYSRQTQANVEKGALTFQETSKFLIVNDTQIGQISGFLKSENLEDWIGKKVTLVVQKVKVGREMHDAIRVEAVKASPNGQAQPEAPAGGNSRVHTGSTGPVVEKAKPDHAAIWKDQGDDRFKFEQVREKWELWELCKFLGIDGEQIKSVVDEKGGDLSAAYDAMLSQYAGLIIVEETTSQEEE